MARVIFFSIPAHGHTNPTLPVVQTLVNKGEEVIYYSSKEFKEKVISTGAIYREYAPMKSDQYINQASKDLAMLYFFMVDTTFNIVDQLVADVRSIQPDYIIHDAICPWGRYAAAICNLPAISSVPTFALSGRAIDLKKSADFFKSCGFKGLRYILAARRLQRLLEKKYSVKPRGFIDTMMNEEPLNIVYTSERLQPNVENFDPIKYKFVGPSITDRKNDPDTTDYSKLKHPIIYIAMGTVWKDSFRAEDMVDALRDLGYTLVISGVCADEKYYHFNDVIIKDHINQMEVLKHCNVFVTHGGMNSVNEALYWGVPLCIHPFQMEQKIVADRIVEVKCGVRIEKLSKEIVRGAVQLLIKDHQYKENCEIFSKSFIQAGGYRKAAEHILTHVRLLSNPNV